MFDLIAFIKAIGYFGIFGVVFAESGLFIGFFLPGDSFLFSAGFLASQNFLNIWCLMFLIFIGAVLGDNFGYAFGKKVGPMIFKKEDSLLFHKNNLEKAKIFYDKYGGMAVILARFMPGIRTFAPILAGVGKMNYSKFLFFNVIGGFLWGISLPLLGYYLGSVIPNIDKYIIPIICLIILLSVLPILINFLKNKSIKSGILKSMNFRKTSKLLVFNWKMNPETLEEALQIAKDGDHKNAVIVPPFVFIQGVGKILKMAELGAQDLFYKEKIKGSFTGEISAAELVNLGVKYVIVGHSERRAMGETDEIIAQKLNIALRSDLIPILCVGENIEERERGLTKKIIENQINRALNFAKNENKPLILAYEPVWAIGTGNYCSPKDTSEIIGFIKNLLATSYYLLDIKVLYGGSVTPENIKDFLKYKEIDGVLIGGASLKPDVFFNQTPSR